MQWWHSFFFTNRPGGRTRTFGFPDISRTYSPLYDAREKHSGRELNPQLLFRGQTIYPVNRPEYKFKFILLPP